MTPVDQLTANTASGKSTFRTGRLQCDSRRKDKATKARARKQQALNAASIHYNSAYLFRKGAYWNQSVRGVH